MPATATARPVGDLICPVCNDDVPNADTGRCDLCGRVVCGHCLKAVASSRDDGLWPGTYCLTCLGPESEL